MASFTGGIESLISSIFAIFGNILNSILAVFQSIFAVFQTVLVSVFDLGKSLLNFFLSNIVVLAILAVAFVGYTAFTQRSAAPAGRGVGASRKKTT